MKYIFLYVSPIIFSTFLHAMQSEPKRAIISVYDKTGIGPLAVSLFTHGYTEIVSTGNTYRTLEGYLRDNAPEYLANLKKVSEVTEFPEILDGRVKTLHPKIHGGLLADMTNSNHVEQLKQHNIEPFNLVVGNLYPFSEVVQKSNTTLEEAIENIDIGGPTMICSAAKNFKDISVITNPKDYVDIMQNPETTLKQRKKLAAHAFAHIARYHTKVTNYLGESDIVLRKYTKKINLKYGENPHQKNAGVYTIDDDEELPFKILSGNLGYINIGDALRAYQIVKETQQALGKDKHFAIIEKHFSPCGGAIATTPAQAFNNALGADPKSAFGGFIAMDEVDEETAKLIKPLIMDGFIARKISDEALKILSSKKNNSMPVLLADLSDVNPPKKLEFREMFGVALAQEPNCAVADETYLQNIVTENKDIPELVKCDMIFGNIAVKLTQSNSTVIVTHDPTESNSTEVTHCLIGVAGGQQNRVDCVRLALVKAISWHLRRHPKIKKLYEYFKKGMQRADKVNEIISYIEGNPLHTELFDFGNLTGQELKDLEFTFAERDDWIKKIPKLKFILASDAFFPFPDSIKLAAEGGVKYIIQPGRNMEDPKKIHESDKPIIAECDKNGIAMILTGIRGFGH